MHGSAPPYYYRWFFSAPRNPYSVLIIVWHNNFITLFSPLLTCMFHSCCNYCPSKVSSNPSCKKRFETSVKYALIYFNFLKSRWVNQFILFIRISPEIECFYIKCTLCMNFKCIEDIGSRVFFYKPFTISHTFRIISKPTLNLILKSLQNPNVWKRFMEIFYEICIIMLIGFTNC